MARSSMADLITRSRTLISDTGSPPVFTDNQIQDALDVWRQEVHLVLLRAMPSFAPGGGVHFLDYYSDMEAWEADVLLQGMSFQTLTPAYAELLVGHWHFNETPPGIGIRVTGKVYDVYASAADLLESWGAQVKLDFGFQSGTDRYNRKDKFDAIMELATKYRSLSQPHMGVMVQTDAAPDHDGGGVVYPSMSPQDGP